MKEKCLFVRLEVRGVSIIRVLSSIISLEEINSGWMVLLRAADRGLVTLADNSLSGRPYCLVEIG